MSSQAHWSNDDIITLVTFLLSKKASAGDGISFKGSVWTEAATAVNKILPTKGAKKTSGSCKSKWGKVGYLLSSVVVVTDWPIQLKETNNIVADIKAQSGFKWDDNRGADIDETTAEVWAPYEKVFPASIFEISC